MKKGFDKKKEEAILAELYLLAEMRRLHEWTAFRTSEAEDVEKTEEELLARIEEKPAEPVTVKS